MLQLVDARAPNILSRSRRLMNVCTGFRLVDCLFPIGTGQRELIIGDRQTGKSTLAVSMVFNQISTNCESTLRKVFFSVYVCTAQKCSNVMRLYELFRRNRVGSYVCLMFASVVESMSLQYISPLSGTAISEYFRNQGFHSIIVYDDLSKHAVSYRQLSLALRKPAGREAFPSDIFYLHARLLERSCCLNFARGNGTLTCLPIIETLNNDLSAYVATNVISITDGQLYLDAVLFGHGIFPAVSIEKSVSRVGAKSLDIFWRAISFRVYAMMNEYKQELESVVKSSLFKLRKHRWDRIYAFFQQRSPYYHYFNVLILLCCLHGQCDLLSVKFTRLFEYTLICRDVTILFGVTPSPYMYSFNWLTYYVLRLVGPAMSELMRSVWTYTWCFSHVFRHWVVRRVTKVAKTTGKYMSYVMDSIQYLSSTCWRDKWWKQCEPLSVFLTSLQDNKQSNVSITPGMLSSISQWMYVRHQNSDISAIYW